MASVETLSLRDLQVSERTEVETAMRVPLRPGDTPQGAAAFLADNDDIIALWLLLLMVGASGIGVYCFAGLPVPYAREAALVGGLGLIVWTVRAWVSTHKRRGCIFTSFGTFKARGATLHGVRHGNVKAIKCRTIGRPGKRFTVFELVATDDRAITLYAHNFWAEAAIASIQRARGGHIPVAER